MIKVAIIGYGYAAKTFHIPLLGVDSDFKLVALVSKKSQEQIDFDKNINVYPNVEDLIKNQKIDLAIIATPPKTHHFFAMQLLMANINIVIEKPVTHLASQALEIADFANKKKLHAFVFQNRRLDADFLTVKKLIKEQQLLDIKSFISRFDRLRLVLRDRWREIKVDGAGILFDIGSHLIDQSIDLFAKPRAITAFCKEQKKDATTTDYFNLRLHYQSFDVLLQSHSFAHAPNQRFEINSKSATFLKFDLDKQEEYLKQGLVNNKGKITEKGYLYKNLKKEKILCELGSYHKYYENIKKSLKNNAQSSFDISTTIDTIKIIELAEKSSNLEKTLVLEN